jgi:hypothetical protein
MKPGNYIKSSTCSSLIFIVLLFFTIEARAAVVGKCSNCHTMHNSQNNTVMVTYTYGSETTDAKIFLLRGTCLGCHARGTSNKIEDMGGNDTPQVYHNDATGDLAGGNFKYIIGGADAKGHNAIEFGNYEDTLAGPPGHHEPDNILTDITCAGVRGCHGKRKESNALIDIKGSHHKNTDGKCDTADQVYNSYRFLWGVKGLENPTDKWQNKSDSSHNEYFGSTTPMTFASCNDCHDPGGKRPQSNTISGFCSTCHGAFHFMGWMDGDPGIGSNSSSPFMRHPTDVLLPGSGEYADYNGAGNPYSIIAPVARTTPVPDTISDTVPVGTGVVMCLSCHSAHATNFDDMLRWDFKSSTLSTALSGCNVCHTGKN